MDLGIRVLGFRAQVSGLGPEGVRFRVESWGGQSYCRNLTKKPWAFIRAPYMNPTILGVIGPS